MNAHHTYATKRKLPRGSTWKRLTLLSIIVFSFYGVYSQSYVLQTSAFSHGAQEVSSSSYTLNPTFGQQISGTVSSANYTFTAGFLPTAIPREAELTLQSTLNISPSEVPPGGTTSLSFTLFNSGAVDVFATISAEVYLSANIDLEAGDILLDNFEIITNLAAGATLNFPQGSNTKSLEIPEGTTVGDYFILVDLKTSTPIEEINSNNVFSQPLTVSNTTAADVTAPSVTSITPTNTFSASEEIIATITDASEIESASLFHRHITGSDFTSVNLTKSGSNFFVEIQDSWADEIGMEGYIIARDIFGNTIQENPNTHFFLYRELDPTEPIPLLTSGNSFDGKARSYRMFSIPYELEDKSLVSIFDELGGYDPNKWRIFHYSNGQYNELLDGLNNIALGDGYWFNTTVPDFSIEIGAGTADNVTRDDPFTKNFVQGWNQIGNPYPFTINWTDIQNANPDQGLGSLQLYQNGGYQAGTTLNPWEGAFVFCETAGTVTFPLSANASGRTSSVDQDFEWKLDLHLQLNDIKQTSAIGMHQLAKKSKDRMDEIIIPRFITYLEMTTEHPEYFAPRFSTDIVPPSGNHEWTFTLESSEKDGIATLQWDLASLETISGKCFLLDHATLKVIDMSLTAETQFNWENGRQFSIYYTEDGKFTPSQNHIGQVYPNPFEDLIKIPLLVKNENQLLSVTVIDAQGREINRLQKSFDGGGLHTFEWDGKDANGHEASNGVYFYKIDLNGKEKVVRIIKH